jgi:hypothetical protein
MFHFVYTHRFDNLYENNAVVDAANLEEATQKLVGAVGPLEGFKIKSSKETSDIVFIGCE